MRKYHITAAHCSRPNTRYPLPATHYPLPILYHPRVRVATRAATSRPASSLSLFLNQRATSLPDQLISMSVRCSGRMAVWLWLGLGLLLALAPSAAFSPARLQLSSGLVAPTTLPPSRTYQVEIHLLTPMHGLQCDGHLVLAVTASLRCSRKGGARASEEGCQGRCHRGQRASGGVAAQCHVPS